MTLSVSRGPSTVTVPDVSLQTVADARTTLRAAGFREVEEGERRYWFEGEELAHQANYVADVLESALDALAQLPGVDEEELRAGLADLRGLPGKPGAGLGWVYHKSTAVH